MLKSEILRRLEKILVKQFGDKVNYRDPGADGVIVTALDSFEKSLCHSEVKGECVADFISIWWHVDDVRTQAGWLGSESGWEDDEYYAKYDRTKMHEVLHILKHRHDCTIGINWEVIDVVLDTYGLKEES